MKRTTAFLLLVALAAFACGADTEPLPEAVAYDLDLRIDYGNRKVHATCTLTFTNKTDRPVTRLPLLLYRLLAVKSVVDGNQAALPFSQEVVSITGWEQIQVNYVEIELDDDLLPGEEGSIELAYEGYLFGYSADGWRYVKDHIDPDFTLIRSDGYGYPVIACPDDKGMMPAQVRHDYTIRVSVPEGMMVVTGGKLVEQTSSDGISTFTYCSKKPSWRMDIAVSDYGLFEEGENRVYYFARDSLGAARVMRAMKSSFDLYTDWFGPLDKYLGYSVIEVPEGYGSQFDVCATILSAGSFDASGDMNTVYHEIAHAWNVNNLEQQPSRIESEGYARFLEFLLLEKIDGKEGAVAEAAGRYLDRIRASFTEHPEYRKIPIKDYGVEDMTNYSYSLGMVVFAVFYEVVGEELFNHIIGSFYNRYHKSGATLDQFITHCLETTGPGNTGPDKNLERFFDDWIYTTDGIQLVMEGLSLQELVRFYSAI